ncbi:hypothetical protein NVP1187O_232 [Vibrio phage 1.187.O._10N.286.49.F1]|nr:hypothetical protein NVP1187O_232 [Vibrio phage 1.187.O._10N.286.49.F1]
MEISASCRIYYPSNKALFRFPDKNQLLRRTMIFIYRITFSKFVENSKIIYQNTNENL